MIMVPKLIHLFYLKIINCPFYWGVEVRKNVLLEKLRHIPDSLHTICTEQLKGRT